MLSNNKKKIDLQNIKISDEKISEYSKNLDLSLLLIPDWKEEVFLIENNKKDIEFLFLINTINFSYWQDSGIEKWTVEYNGKTYSGSMALFAALKKAVLKGYPLFDNNYLKNISEKDLQDILSGTSVIPMLKERVNILREIAKVFIDNDIKSFYDILQAANGSAINLINKLDELFPSFRDKYLYNNEQFYFYKRAQLICAMLYGRYSGKSTGSFHDIEQLVIFADYRVPQTLRKLGLVEYNDYLSKIIESKIYLLPGSPEELEIRISSIIAAEKLKEQINLRLKQKINALHLDYFLWQEGKRITKPEYDFHRTRTIFY